MRESAFQAKLIRELEATFPGCIILKNDANNRQGIPDLIVLFGDRWAALEVKASWFAPHQPNQDYYVERMDEMSFAAFICPENKQEIIDEIQATFGARR